MNVLTNEYFEEKKVIFCNFYIELESEIKIGIYDW